MQNLTESKYYIWSKLHKRFQSYYVNESGLCLVKSRYLTKDLDNSVLYKIEQKSK